MTMPKHTIDDLTPDEKNAIVKDFVAPSETKLIKLAEHLKASGVTIESAKDLHEHVKEYGDDRIKAFYGQLVTEMFLEKDQYIIDYLENEDDSD